MSVQDVVKRLTEVQQKIETFKSLLVDPDLAEYVRGLSSNGATRSTAKRESDSSERTGLKTVILGLPLPPQFSINDVVKALEVEHFDFGGRSPVVCVRDSLYVAAKHERGIRLVKKGNRNGKPNLYEKIL